MQSSVRVVTPATVEPVTVTECKLDTRVDGATEDALFSAWIAAARAYVETRLSRALITQTLELTLDAWPEDPILELPMPPLQSVVSVTYTDYAGVATIWPATQYQVLTAGTPGAIGLAYGAAWPSATLRSWAGIAVRYVAGYGPAASSVPMPICQAMRLLVGHWYANREGVAAGNLGPLPFAIDALLYPYEVR